ncbi:MAG: eukaryotic-like serine/threonine-protein kinase, partial [Acidobacteriota bacterium]|nr:eukaryotic-like serine/threonine-protein kinase [Acidobacteriota bacterium]
MTIGDTTSPPGESLKTRLARRSLPLAEALDLGAQIAAGLAAVHARGIVHGDVQPANVWISAEERVTVLDPPVRVLGKTPYRSPEQLWGGPVDARTDIWSLGMILYEMLAGSLPFEDSEGERGRTLLGDEPVAVRLPGLPPNLHRIVERALAKSPAARYARIE